RADLGARPVDAVLFGLYVLVLGVVCLTFAAVLRPVAAAADTAREAVEAAEDRRRAVDAAGRDVAAQERALHDVVLNTLGVIARGVPGDPERVRGWCARAAAEVSSLPTPRP